MYLQTLDELMDDMMVQIEMWFFFGREFYIVFKRVGVDDTKVGVEYSLPINLHNFMMKHIGFGTIDADSVEVNWEQEERSISIYKTRTDGMENSPNDDILNAEYTSFMMR